MADSLSKKTIYGGMWALSLRLFAELLEFTRIVIVARILAPDDFGLIGIAALVVSTLDRFSQTGFTMALIQLQRPIKDYLDSAWTLQILRGFFLYTIAYFSAPFVATFFEAPRSAAIIQVFALSIVLEGSSNICTILFHKNLDFRKEFAFRAAGSIAGTVSGILAVVLMRNVWGLVVGMLAGSLVSLIASYAVYPYLPRFSVDLRKARELIRYGKWIAGSKILAFFLKKGDKAVVGKMLDTSALGFYSMAYRISCSPMEVIVQAVSTTSFPAFSRIQDDIQKIKAGYARVLEVLLAVTVPILVATYYFAPDFVLVFLGEKWMPVVPAVRLLTVFSFFRALSNPYASLLQARGKPREEVLSLACQLPLMVILAYPLTARWGMEGMSLTIAISMAVTTAYLVTAAFKDIGFTPRDLLKSLWAPLLCSSLTVALLSTAAIVIDRTSVSGKAGLAAIALASYAGIFLLLARIFRLPLLQQLPGLFRNRSAPKPEENR